MIKKSILLISILLTYLNGFSQISTPDLIFKEHDPGTYSHLTSDGYHFYTASAIGKKDGRITKYSSKGHFIKNYFFDLSISGVMYNSLDNKLYVNCKDFNIYRIRELEQGYYNFVQRFLFSNPEATLTISTNGKYLCSFEAGKLELFRLSNGKLLKTFTNLQCGKGIENGEASVAVDDNYIYTWDASIKTIFVYNQKGKKVQEVVISNGNYGPSLSLAQGLIFVSSKGGDDDGTWYGYNIWRE